MKLLTDFWNDHQRELRLEDWDTPNTYMNHWEIDSFLLPIPEEPTVAGEELLMDKIYDLVQPILSNWVGGLELTKSSLYGIRVYKQGSILVPHVDRLPLVTSAIINVAQNVGEPWPLEVYGHDGVARNMTLEPGEMILYESHSVIHGRPFPLVGDADSFYANVFIHFEPLGHTERHTKKAAHGANTENTKELYEEALRKQRLEETGFIKRSLDDMPAYIEKGSAEEARWKQLYMYSPDIRKVESETTKPKTPTEPEGMTPHTAAALGKLQVLKSMHSRKPELLHKEDANGWTPMHEAARSGKKEVLEFLVKNGGKVNERTNKGKGGTPLWWAQQMFDANHPAVQFLQENGALNLGPEL
jgi:prolyl 4-hydroxylase